MSDCGRFEVRFGGEVKPKAPLPHQLWWGISPTIAEVELCLEQLAATGFVLAMSVPVLAGPFSHLRSPTLRPRMKPAERSFMRLASNSQLSSNYGSGYVSRPRYTRGKTMA